MLPVIVICVEDVKKIIPHFDVSYLEKHKAECRALLYNLGLDTNYGIEIQEKLISRTKLCGVVETDRIVGVERTDIQWLQSGNASHEAKTYSDDISMRVEISKMSKGTRDKEANKENEE